MSSYKSSKGAEQRRHNSQKTVNVLKPKLTPLEPSLDRYGELRHLLLQLLVYTDARIRQFPRDEKWPAGLGCVIMSDLRDCYALIFAVAAYNPKYDREQGLRQLSVKLKIQMEYVTASYRAKYITAQNLEAWQRQLVAIDNQVIAMAMYLQRHETTTNQTS